MIDRRLLKEFDWLTLLLSVLLASFGALGIYSATRTHSGPSPLFYDHLLRLGIGYAALFTVLLVDYRTIVRHAYLLYAGCFFMLTAVEIVGLVGMGAQRWLAVGGFRMQPSEFLKVALVLFFARYLGGIKKNPPLGLRDVMTTIVAAAVPFILILKQPDLGTAMIVAGICVIVLFAAGLDMRIFLWSGGTLLLLGTVLAGLARAGVFNILSLLHDYQVRRLKVLFNPDLDPLGAGYHINQSKIAIGSGGLAGKGFLAGTQSGLNFLPQQHTDFIFSVLAEEGGFMVSATVLALVLTLLLWGMHTARQARDRSGSYLALGVVAILFLHASVNVGMTTGIFPVVGLPLPILSYGGSSVLTTFVGLGLIMNVRMRRYSFE